MIEFSVPSKVFIAGEYLALSGGPTLIANVDPRFKMHLQNKGEGPSSSALELFHPQSLAGKLIHSEKETFADVQMSFEDPFNGAGGFGRSSAEFILTAAVLSHLKNKKFETWSTLETYGKFAQNDKVPPSGADLVAQCTGQVTYFSKTKKKIEMWSWPWEDLGFMVLSTGFKLKTHEHLAALSPEKIAEIGRILSPSVEQIISSFRDRNKDSFILGISQLSECLEQKELLFQATKNLIDLLTEQLGVVAKGCGALGADVVILFFDKSGGKVGGKIDDKNNNAQSKIIEASVRAMLKAGQKIIATDKNLSKGLVIHERK